MTEYYTCPECNGHRRYCGCKEKEKAKEMTDKQTPPDWVLIEAAKRGKWTVRDIPTLRAYYGEYSAPYRALCDMIERYEQPPVDRKLLCAREAAARTCQTEQYSKAYRAGEYDDTSYIVSGARAIELWEEGYGK